MAKLREENNRSLRALPSGKVKSHHRLRSKEFKNFFGFAFADSLEKGGRRNTSAGNLAKAQDWGAKTAKYEKEFRLSPWRLAVVYLVVFGCLVLVLGKSLDLQIIKGASFFGSAKTNSLRVVVDHAPRGAIFDRNGKILAENIPGFRLVLEKGAVSKEKQEKLVDDLSKILGEELDKNELFSSDEDLVVIKTNLSNDKALLIEAQIESLPGMTLEVRPVRSYPEKDLLANILGYTSEADQKDLAKKTTVPYSLGDSVGKFGVEQSMESVLRGVNGYTLISTDASGNKTGQVYESQRKPGKSIYLSIDLDLQRVTRDSLAKWMKTKGAQSGSSVVLDPSTGEILAMVSLPSFDNNLFAKGISQKDYSNLINDSDKRLINRPISASYPPGSTFKMITSVAGLESGVIKPDTKIVDQGFINLGGIIFNNWYWTDHEKTEGAINIVRALARSTDTFFYEVGMRTGEKTVQDWAKKFGLGQKSGIDLPGEEAGLVPTAEWKKQTKGEPWYPGETLNISIGQGDLLATPLQISLVTAAFANGGKLIIPTIQKDSPPTVLKENFLKEQTLKTVREGLYQNTVGDGNVGWLFASFPVPTAGKTGSAETGNGAPHAWYTGFAPYISPKIVVTVQVENAGHGSEVSAPVVKDVFTWYFSTR